MIFSSIASVARFLDAASRGPKVAVPLLVSVWLLSCESPQEPGLISDPPSAEIVDAAHSNGREGFYFLPPLVPQPQFAGEFDPDFLPFLAVEICEWSGSECVGPIVARFTSEGKGSERLRIGGGDEDDDDEDDEGEEDDDEEDEDDEDSGGRFYKVNWHTRTSNLHPAKTYRIRVLAGTVELGHADVDVVARGRELRNVDTGQFIALKNGRTLPIKFRVEERVTGIAVLDAEGGRVESSVGAAAVIPAGSLEGNALVSIDPTTLSSTPLPPLSGPVIVFVAQAPIPGSSSPAFIAQGTPTSESGFFDIEFLLPSAVEIASLEVQATPVVDPSDVWFLTDRKLVQRGEQTFLVVRTHRGLFGEGVGVIYVPETGSSPACDGEYELLRAPEDALDPASPDRRPLVYIHGWQAELINCDLWQAFDPESKGREIFGHLNERQLFNQFQYWRFTYPTLNHIDAAAQRLVIALDERFPDLGNIVLIGHSMGGLVARAAVEQHGLRDRVSGVITLGTPHRGALLASQNLSPLPAVQGLLRRIAFATEGARDLSPTSDFIENLKITSSLADNTLYHTFAGKVDLTTVVPCGSGSFLCGVLQGWVVPRLQVAIPGTIEFLAAVEATPNDGIVEAASAFLPGSIEESDFGLGLDHFEMSRGNFDGDRFPCERDENGVEVRPCNDPLLQRVAEIVEGLVGRGLAGAWELHFDRNGNGTLGTAEVSVNTMEVTVDSETEFTAVLTDIVTTDNIAGQLRSTEDETVVLMWGPGNRTAANYFHVHVGRLKPDGSLEGGWVDVARQTGDWVLVRPGQPVIRSPDASTRLIPTTYRVAGAADLDGAWTLSFDETYNGVLVPGPVMKTISLSASDATRLGGTLLAGGTGTVTGRVLTAGSRDNSIVALMLQEPSGFTALAGSMIAPDQIVGVWFSTAGESGDFVLVRETAPLPATAILFTSSADGSPDIWAIGVDGAVRTNVSRVSHDPSGLYSEGEARWSSDGSQVVFTSNKGGPPSKAYVMNADGSGARALNANANTEFAPFWSANGRKVYYVRNPQFPATDGAGCGPCPFWELYEYDLDAGQETRLTSNASREWSPIPSPDGASIAFTRAEQANDCCNPTNVWIMDADGQNARQLSPSNGQYEWTYDWDPVNNRILTTWGTDVVLMDPDGAAEQLTFGSTTETGVAFSPDGSAILVGIQGDIHILDIATRQMTALVVEAGDQLPTDWGTVWSPLLFSAAAPSEPRVGLASPRPAMAAKWAPVALGFDTCTVGIANREQPVIAQVDLVSPDPDGSMSLSTLSRVDVSRVFSLRFSRAREGATRGH